jgi:holo-[acyl-carrier protein] synthase
MGVRVGIDLVAVADVHESVCAHADRYLTRIYSSRELADCMGHPSAVAAERLAARFAAKEAAMKVLRQGGEEADPAIPWSAIEVVRDASGAPGLAFSGRAAELAREAGVATVAVSLTHERTYAAAVVVAVVGSHRSRGRGEEAA